MAIHGYRWLYMGIHGYTWVYMVIDGYTWLYMVIAELHARAKRARGRSPIAK